MSLLLGWGAYVRDKNTSVRLCAKKAGGAYARGGAYLRDTMVMTLLAALLPPFLDESLPQSRDQD